MFEALGPKPSGGDDSCFALLVGCCVPIVELQTILRPKLLRSLRNYNLAYLYLARTVQFRIHLHGLRSLLASSQSWGDPSPSLDKNLYNSRNLLFSSFPPLALIVSQSLARNIMSLIPRFPGDPSPPLLDKRKEIINKTSCSLRYSWARYMSLDPRSIWFAMSLAVRFL